MSKTITSSVPVTIDTIDARIEELERFRDRIAANGKYYVSLKQRLGYLRKRRIELIEEML